MPIPIAPCCLLALAPVQTDGALDFSERPGGAVQLIGSEGHQMVPEAEGASGWTFADGVLTAPTGWDSVVTPEAYGDFRMHLEFNVNSRKDKSREKNGNSGVYIQQRYELQILDSYGVSTRDYQAWDCGSLYRLRKPEHLACRPAGTWQSFDILFRAARFDGPKKVEDARITVFHNDVLIHENFALPRKTGAGKAEGPAPGPIKLQGHQNAVQFRNAWIEALTLEALPTVPPKDPRRITKVLPLPGQVFTVEGRAAFVMEPAQKARRSGPMPWVWYAPTLPRLPAKEEAWMFERLLAQGIAIAGIDVGESYGSPKGRALYEALYAHLRAARGYGAKPALLARSRGGLMLYSWAAEHPESVAGVAGIYPVCNIASYPGIGRAAPAYGFTAAELAEALARHNPIDRMAPLAKAGVPILHIHGDQDTVVPLDKNSAVLAERYGALGGNAEVLVQAGRGHDMWPGWFQSKAIVDFLIERAHAGTAKAPPEKR